LFIEEVGFLFG